MAVIIELRDRQTHAGVPLVHPDSEHVVLANVFGIVKNLPPDTVLNPWLSRITEGAIAPASSWQPEFWERQPRPQHVHRRGLDGSRSRAGIGGIARVRRSQNGCGSERRDDKRSRAGPAHAQPRCRLCWRAARQETIRADLYNARAGHARQLRNPGRVREVSTKLGGNRS